MSQKEGEGAVYYIIGRPVRVVERCCAIFTFLLCLFSLQIPGSEVRVGGMALFVGANALRLLLVVLYGYNSGLFMESPGISYSSFS